MAGLKKAAPNWVDGDRFFDPKAEIDVLTDRVRNGTHTFLTAARSGKVRLADVGGYRHCRRRVDILRRANEGEA